MRRCDEQMKASNNSRPEIEPHSEAIYLSRVQLRRKRLADLAQSDPLVYVRSAANGPKLLNIGLVDFLKYGNIAETSAIVAA